MIPDELTQHDPTEQHRGERRPAEQQAEDDAGHGVEHHVGDARDESGPQPGPEFGLVVLEPEREQEEQHTDLGGEGDELLADVERDHAALADDEAGEEVERDGGDPDAPGESRQDRQRQHDGADLDERERRLRRPGGQHDQRPGGGPRIERNVARPSSVPTATTTSRGSNTKSGSGAGTVVSPRMTATTDAPVRVRNCPSAIVWPINGDVGAEVDPLDRQPFDLLANGRHRLGHPTGPEELRQGLRVGGRQLHPLGARVGILAVVDEDLPPPVAAHEHADPRAVGGGEVVAHPDPGQVGLANVRHAASLPRDPAEDMQVPRAPGWVRHIALPSPA